MQKPIADDPLLSLTESLSGVTCVNEVWQRASKFLDGNGIDCPIYMFMRPSAPEDRPLAMANMPKWWMDYYLDEDRARHDPFFKTCATYTAFMTGSDYLDENVHMLEKNEIRFIQEASETGVRSGLSSPVKLINPGHFGGWNFGSSLKRTEFDKIAQLHGQTLRLAGFIIHDHLQEAAFRQIDQDQSQSWNGILSSRERECLLWLASGLKSAQIAERLDLALVTVDMHFKNARKKLNAATREEALAKAIIGGEISL